MNSIKDGNLSNLNCSSSMQYSLSEGDDAISRALVSARASATPLDAFPGAAPESMAQAYAIQAASIARWPDTVGGWKVGLLSPQDQVRYSAERLVGPIFRSQIHEVAAGSGFIMPVYVGGFAALEAEFVFRLGTAISPDNRPLSDEELGGLVAGLHVGAEIASSPIAEINDLGPTVVTADFGNNAGLLLGPEIPDWQDGSPEDWPARAIVDGVVVGDASAANIPGGPIAALRFAVAVAAMRGIELPAGTLISTGAATGIHDVVATSLSRVEFGEIGGFDVTYESMSGA